MKINTSASLDCWDAVCCFIRLPSPESEGFAGEDEGRFPLGGLSDIPGSLGNNKELPKLATQFIHMHNKQKKTNLKTLTG